MMTVLPRLEFGKGLPQEDAEAYVAKLRSFLLEHYQREVEGGRYLQALAKGKLPLEANRLFWQNWYGFVQEINNLLGCIYQKQVSFFSQHPDLQAPFAAQVADELIHPVPPGHIGVVLKQGQFFGLKDEEMKSCPMLPECRAFLEWYRGLLYEGTMMEWWCSYILEEGVGHWAKFYGQALTGPYGLSKAETVYFHMHAEADLKVHGDGILGHADFDWMVVQRLLEEGRTEFRPGFSPEYCVRTSVAYFAWFFEGILREIERRGTDRPLV